MGPGLRRRGAAVLKMSRLRLLLGQDSQKLRGTDFALRGCAATELYGVRATKSPEKEEDVTNETLQGKPSVSLTANDLERSLRFYEGLGFVVDERYEVEGRLQGVMMRAGEALLGVSQDDFAKGRDRVKGVGMSFYVETDQDIAALARRAKEAGVRLDGEPAPMPWGPMGFRATDPDGFKITICNRS